MLHHPGFRHVSPQPVHAGTNPGDQEGFRSNLGQLAKAGLPDGVSSEDVLVFFRNEARIGQKGVLSRIWAPKGTRPRVPRDYRYG